MRARLSLSAAIVVLSALLTPSAAAAAGVVKLAFFNIQSGKGEVGFPGRPAFFTDTQNCTDTTQPVNAWGVGFVQQALVSALRDDQSIIALGLAEAWVCGAPENVRQLLGWKAKTSTKNGVAIVARYGFAGPETWQQLDTTQNPDPADTMWVVRAPVCADAACSRSIVMYAAHWYGTGTYKRTVYDKQAQQTLDFMAKTAAGQPHVLTGDLNAWEGTTEQCGQNPINAGVQKLRAASYIDAWPRIHGTMEGFTGMTNRSGCGSPAGYTWKRIDYAWSSPGLEPIDMVRFATPEVPGDAAPSDHYGIITTYPLDADGAAPDTKTVDTTAPAAGVTAPAAGATVSGTTTIDIAASDDTAVVRVDIVQDGQLLQTLTGAPYRVTVNTTQLIDGLHTVQARAFDAAGNTGLSQVNSFTVKNAVAPPPAASKVTPGDIVLYAQRASAIVGAWKTVNDATAAGGKMLSNPNANGAKLAAAAAQPASYFELTFTPVAGQAYRLWVRGRAEKDSWANDSVFVQFSGSVTASGAAAFRVGTTAATSVNLEDASNAGVSGWGWQDNGYGANVFGSVLYFDGTPQTLRVQPREDGLSIDQIVLSPVTYMNAAPGGLKQDATILPETVAAPKPSLDEIVLRSSAATVFGGSWKKVADATAAEGFALTHPDAGVAKLPSALAAPLHFVELTFEAEAGRNYRLWIRGRADKDSWANDSVFVQFSGAVDAKGAAVSRIGTTSAQSVNIEDASNAGVAGWGWQDKGYGVATLGPTVSFATTGPQTIRIQTREDGLRIDQIVLSSGKYLTAAPGALKNDATILP